MTNKQLRIWAYEKFVVYEGKVWQQAVFAVIMALCGEK